MKRDKVIQLFAFGSVVWVFVIGALALFGVFGDPNTPPSLGSLIAWIGPLIITIVVAGIPSQSGIHGSSELRRSSQKGGVQIENLTLHGESIYLEDEQGCEDIEFETSELLQTANKNGDLVSLREIYKEHRTSSDPAVLLAQRLCWDNNHDEAETILLDALKNVKKKSHVAYYLGHLYLFDKNNIISGLLWLTRSIIAQRNNPYLPGPYIYMYGILTVLSHRWISFEKESKTAKIIADKLSKQQGGIELDHSTIRNFDIQFSELPWEIVQDVSYDLQKLFKSIKVFR